MSKIVLVTGGFDPIHSGHIKYLEAARQLGHRLFVGLNSDAWLTRKKGRAFMPWLERCEVLRGMSCVGYVFPFDDSDGSAIAFIEDIKAQYPNDEIVFANGGDRTQDNIPEMTVDGVEFVFGVGGEDKRNSSSWILEEWKAPKTERPWGYYRVLHDVAGTKVKELTINPGQSLSMQRHKHRAEHWHVTEGMCQVDSQMDGGYYLPPRTLSKHMTLDIPAGQWHQLTNPYNDPCKLVEIQYGPVCEEDDIERR
jgi:cytidyltransferase-like protein